MKIVGVTVPTMADVVAARVVHSPWEDSRMARLRGRQKGWVRRENGRWKVTYLNYQLTDGEWETYKRTDDLGSCDEILTLKQAQVAAKPFLAKANRVAEKPSVRMSLADFIDQQFKQKAATHHYHYLIKNFVLPALGPKQLGDIRPIDCQQIIDRAGKKYSAQTLKHVRNTLRAIFNRAIGLELIEGRNPASAIAIPEVVAEKRPTYSVEQLAKVLIRLPEPVYQMALLGAAVSLGPSELCGLCLKHCNFSGETVVSDGEVMAPYSLAIREGWYYGKRTRLKTQARRRNVGITADLAEAVAKIVAGNKRQDPDAPIFQSRNGTPLNTNNIEKRMFGELEKELGFSVTWYAFRRASSTLAALVGADLKDRSLIMGHSDDRMTRFYDIQSVERLREVPTAIMKVIGAAEQKAKDEGKLIEFGRRAG